MIDQTPPDPYLWSPGPYPEPPILSVARGSMGRDGAAREGEPLLTPRGTASEGMVAPWWP